MYILTVKILMVYAVFIYGWSSKEASVTNAEKLPIYPRSEWDARPPRDSETLTINPPPFVIIHHSAMEFCRSTKKCSLQVRRIQNYHMDKKEWSDIAYNFLVGEDGNVYEGRGWGIRGAHTRSYNGKSIGICVMGNFINREPQYSAINAIQNLIAYGVSSGKINSSYTLYGSCQLSATESPGIKLYKLIKHWPHWREAKKST